MEDFYNQEISPIELLGYAKNYILDVLEERIDLLSEVKNRLLLAHQFLTKVQEHLYNE